MANSSNNSQLIFFQKQLKNGSSSYGKETKKKYEKSKTFTELILGGYSGKCMNNYGMMEERKKSKLKPLKRIEVKKNKDEPIVYDMLRK